MTSRAMRPWLWLPAQLAHDLSPIYLKMRGSLIGPRIFSLRPRTWRNLEFKNPIGIAGGVDKSGACVPGWWSLGAGFVEVGTVTPRAQLANSGKIIGRDLDTQALWNKMGFPNNGMQNLMSSLEKIKPYATPVFVNIGKNRDTANENAVNDYVTLVNGLNEVADAFVVNISSPNTKGLRDLQASEQLRSLLVPVIQASRNYSRPVLLKLSPDLSESDLKQTLDTSLECGIDGWILTNTTLSRSPHSKFPATEGGVSGAPLKQLSRSALQTAVNHIGNSKGDRLIVSVGGILSSEEVKIRLDLGADLVQIYSGLIFNGPGFIQSCVKELRLAL